MWLEHLLSGDDLDKDGAKLWSLAFKDIDLRKRRCGLERGEERDRSSLVAQLVRALH